jgi:molecular chaperone HtpG
MAEERFGFQAEVSKLLDIVANSLYSNKAVFLRELISNASDACDRLRYAALTRPDLTADDPDLRIDLSTDKTGRTITVTDNGIGMNRADLVSELGTIARSGTAAFVAGLTGDEATDMSLIGQFGVGFYSAFMVADRVEVLTRKAGEDESWRWSSDGKGEFTIAAADAAPRGTAVTLHLRKGADEFLDPDRIRHIVKTYSDHIALPIVLRDGPEPGVSDGGAETLNTASALWTRPKPEISEDQYREFYHHVGHTFDDPWLTLHVKAEGVIEYTSLLFIPSTPPFNLFHPDRKHGVKLYVRRVYITDDCEGLMPGYLRFVRGIVDSQDLPLNISREMLQHNPVLAKIRSGLVKRILDALAKKAEKAPAEYAAFWTNFGAVLKEGIYEDAAQRDRLLELCRFRSTADEGLVSLADAVARMGEGQDAIFFITGEDPDALARSPHLEGFVARGVEVLLLTDPIDEFWVPAVGSYKDKPFRSATKGGVDLGKIKPLGSVAEGEAASGARAAPEPAAAETPGIDALIARFKQTLRGSVKDVRVSGRLTDSPVCLVADEGDMDMHLERILKQHRQIAVSSARILEINPCHGLIRRLAALTAEAGDGAGEADETVADAAHLLLDQARIVEGESLSDPGEFSRRLARMMERGLLEKTSAEGAA